MKRILILMFSILIVASFLTSCDKIRDGKDLKGDIPILLYHSVIPELEEDDSRSMFVSEVNFEKDLKYLKENGYETISLEQMEDYYRGKEIQLPEKPIMITFDDGYLNNYEYAYPLLKKYDTKAVIYLIGWSVGRDTFIDSDKEITPHFSWEQAREMYDSGLIQFGSHTFDLHNEKGLSYGYGNEVGFGLSIMDNESDEEYRSRVEKDLKKSKFTIEEEIGQDVTSIAYPYGEYNETLLDMLEDLGFKSGLITESEQKSKSPLTIRRQTITEDRRISDIL